MRGTPYQQKSRGAPPGSRAAAAALALGAVLLAYPPRAVAERPTTPDRTAITEQSRATVHETYSRFTDVLQRSGIAVEYEVSSFETVLAAEFDTTLVQDVVTTVPERVLRATGSVVNDARLEVVGVSYSASWQEVLDDQVAPGTREWNPTLKQALQSAAAADPKVPTDFIAYTTYQVRISALGKSTSYRACIEWRQLPGSGATGKYLINDPVLLDLDQTASEKRHVAPADEIQRELLERLENGASKAEEELGLRDDPSCYSDFEEYEYPQANAIDDYEHATGNHRSTAALKFRCSCNSRCTSLGTPSFIGTGCYDAGSLYIPGYTHVQRGQPSSSTGMVVEGYDHGASVAATWACFVQSCFFAVGCGGGSIGFTTGVGGRIQANFSGQTVWDGQQSFVGECGRCTVQQPDRVPRGRDGRGPFNPSEEPPNGTGGAWTGGACWMNCSPLTFNDTASCGATPPPCTLEMCEVICQL